MNNSAEAQLFEKMMSGDVSTKSDLGLRNKRMQDKPKVRRMGTHKNESGKSFLLLLTKSIEIPFNPSTGKADEKYNPMTPFSPELTNTTVEKTVKSRQDAYEDAKNMFIRRAGVNSWNTEDSSVITSEDKEVFAPYIEPRVFTIPVFKIMYPTISKNKFGKTFVVEGEYDQETGMLKLDTMPLPLKLSKLHKALIREKVNDLQEQFDSGKLKKNKDDFDDQISSLWDKVKVTGEIRDNYMMGLELDLDENNELVDTAAICEEPDDKFLKRFKLIRYTQKLKTAVDLFKNKKRKFDKFNDFWEIEINCGTSSDPKEVGQKTMFGNATNSIDEIEFTERLVERYRTFVDSLQGQEKLFRDSAFISRFTDSTEKILIEVMSKDLLPLIEEEDGKYLTQRVIEANTDAIAALWPDKADEIFTKAGIGLVSEGTYDEKEAAVKDKQLDEAIAGKEANSEGYDDLINQSTSLRDIVGSVGDDEELDPSVLNGDAEENLDI